MSVDPLLPLLGLDVVALPLLGLLGGDVRGRGTADTTGDTDTATTHQGDHHLQGSGQVRSDQMGRF